MLWLIRHSISEKGTDRSRRRAARALLDWTMRDLAAAGWPSFQHGQ